MTQNIEIEFKNILTQQEYVELLHVFNIQASQFFTQENHYFDTADFALKDNGAALRIRQKKDHYEMTLKQPAEVGLLETNQRLSKEAAVQIIQDGKIPSGQIEGILTKMGISLSNLKYFGSLTTKRVEFEYKQGLLVLDHSYYLNSEDYEMEYEVGNFSNGKVIFTELLKQHGIQQRKTENKISRFYQQKNRGLD